MCSSVSYSSAISPTISSMRSSLVTIPPVPPNSSTTMQGGLGEPGHGGDQLELLLVVLLFRVALAVVVLFIFRDGIRRSAPHPDRPGEQDGEAIGGAAGDRPPPRPGARHAG